MKVARVPSRRADGHGEQRSPGGGDVLAPHPPVPSSAPAYLTSLTGLRFLAAFWVVVYHYGGAYWRHEATWLYNLGVTGYLAPGLFFVLSGFVLTYAYTRTGGAYKLDARKFLVARFSRLYPVYALSLLLALPFFLDDSLTGQPLPIALAKTLASGVAVLGMWQAWVPQLSLKWNFPAWSLSVEAFFYLLFPVLVVTIASWPWRKSLAAMLLLYIGVLAAPALATVAGVVDNGTAQAILFYNPAVHLPLFVTGVLLGHCYLQTLPSCRARGLSAHVRATIMSLCALAALVGVIIVGYGMPTQFFQAGLFTPFFGLLIYSIARGEGAISWLLSNRVMTVLGEASYGIYILQYPLHEWMVRAGRWLTGGDDLAQGPAFFPLYAAALIGVAVLSYYHFERPARRLIQARLAQ